MEKNQHITSLASLAVFRELYNKQTDIYEIISKFLNHIIISQSKYNFTLTEITNLLNGSFGFSITEAVVNTSLGRIENIKKEKEYFTVEKIQKEEENIVTPLQNISIEKSNRILEELFRFISNEQNIELSENEKDEIVQSFCSFLMDGYNNEQYSEFISAFIIANNKNEDFKNELEKIREGVILYSGLTYNPNLNEIGSWQSELTIFLDTEMLYNFAGYNGKLFKSNFDDFFQYVIEINQKGKKKLIHLKYFSEVKERIERFFTKAEYIVKGMDKPNPRTTAMLSVIEGCKDSSDVNEKKTDFFDLLKRSGITEESGPTLSKEENHEYNIIDLQTVKLLSEEFGQDVSENISILNYISILRKDSNQNYFYNILYILLTGNSTTTKSAWHPSVKGENNVPLATNLYWITNKFWFKLNKGFGENSFPKSLGIISKAQTTLSSILSDLIGDKFDELKTKFKDGEITEEQAKSRLINLRKQARKPEDIQQDEIKSILSTISEDSLERFIREQEISERQAQIQSKENTELKAELERKNAEIKQKENEKIKAEEQALSTSLSTYEMLLAEKRESIETLSKNKISYDRIVNRKMNTHKGIIAFTVVGYYILTFGLIYKYSWNLMEQFTYVVNGAMPIVLFFIYSLIFEKKPNILEYIPTQKEKIQSLVYSDFNFEFEKLESLSLEIADLEKKINEIKST
ncbi:MAG: hypothetical protein C0613_00670 [Desulfobulbaceae bacterium]|nr:MAG: hypothetical protein C0613_00670 [Desulfobulbaceae bacterium]